MTWAGKAIAAINCAKTDERNRLLNSLKKPSLKHPSSQNRNRRPLPFVFWKSLLPNGVGLKPSPTPRTHSLCWPMRLSLSIVKVTHQN